MNVQTIRARKPKLSLPFGGATTKTMSRPPVGRRSPTLSGQEVRRIVFREKTAGGPGPGQRRGFRR